MKIVYLPVMTALAVVIGLAPATITQAAQHIPTVGVSTIPASSCGSGKTRQCTPVRTIRGIIMRCTCVATASSGSSSQSGPTKAPSIPNFPSPSPSPSESSAEKPTKKPSWMR